MLPNMNTQEELAVDFDGYESEEEEEEDALSSAEVWVRDVNTHRLMDPAWVCMYNSLLSISIDAPTRCLSMYSCRSA